ncbi:MAG: hypothetical protein H7177_02725 [Rhizobacter sp.]|nr:hypothetical protein [Bacteriovorax sp.]
MKTLFLLLYFAVTISPSHSALIDHHIRNKIEEFNIRPVKTLPINPNRPLIELGHQLFEEKKLSGNRTISCKTCHNPDTGTSDGLPLSQTENKKGILRRNAPALYNAGLASHNFMFWDGRIYYDPKTKIFTTPEELLNGENPKASEITSVLTSALAAQALFPLVSRNEMMGNAGENEIADAPDTMRAWDKIIERLKNENPTGVDTESYAALFSKAYPEISPDNINIGHVGEAIAAFEREEFQSTGSPFQKYLRGDNGAMTREQKEGFAVFMGRGHCIQCHTGGELGEKNMFASVASPQWGEAPLVLDKGRGEITGDEKRNFFFLVPSLLNINLTGPYMHNGAYQTLREVIDHYDYVSESLNNFVITPELQKKIPVKVAVAGSQVILDDIWLSSQSGLFPELKNRLRLNDQEKDYLEIFLKEALTDPKWDR